MLFSQQPAPTEYVSYYGKYISLVPGGNILQTMERQRTEMLSLLKNTPESKGDYSYAPGKWTIKEVIGHINDTERMFAFRAFCFARADKAPLHSFEQDDYVRSGNFAKRTLADLATEFETIRNASISLARSFDAERLQRRGIASGNEFTVRALVYIIPGHERHHFNILRERYL